MPVAMSAGLTLSSKIRWPAAAPPPDVLTWCPLKNSHAIAAPITPPMSASSSASASTDITIAVEPKPIARNVAISRRRALTAEYIVLSALKIAPTAMMPPTT